MVLVDKGRLGGGASGIAGGIVRNYYRADAITELVRLSVEMFEEDPEAYGFRQVGYLAAVPAEQVEDLVAIREQHARVGYESELVVGADACREYLTWSWPDWEAPVEALLHERRGGWADAMQTVRHLAARARAARAWRSARACRSWGSAMGDVALHERGSDRVRDARAGDGTLGARESSWTWTRAYLKAQEGEFALAGAGLSGPGGQRGAGGAPRPDAAAALGPRRAACWWTARGASTSGWAGPAPG